MAKVLANLFLSRKLLTIGHVNPNQMVRNSHSPGGIPGEVKFESYSNT